MGRCDARETRWIAQGSTLLLVYYAPPLPGCLKVLSLTRLAGLSGSPTAASFVRPTRPADRRQSFIGALREKYASEAPQPGDAAAESQAVVISGKVAEEMGFDKIRRRLARVADLRIVILDGMRVAAAAHDGEGRVADTCPGIAHLDLSRNLFERLGPVVDICAQLPALRRLSLK